MSAERLREAAKLMRTRAECATPGPWRQEFYRDGELLPDGTGGMDAYETAGSGVYVIDTTSDDGYCLTEFHAGSPRDATHIASWHPAVALAVADLLERLADDREMDPYLTKHFDAAAVALADAYLKATS